MSFNYDPTTDEGRVRLLLSDIDENNPVFDDAEITAFLALNAGVVLLAAAQAIDVNASNETLASKVLKSQDIQVDGAKIADALRAHAQRLREQWAEEQDGYFEVVESGPTPSPELTGGSGYWSGWY